MFDIGFWELTLIGLVALIVIGPDKLPGLARTAGLWIGKARHFLGNVKADIDRELKADEIRRALQNNADIDELKQILNETRDTLNEKVSPDYLVKADEGEAADTGKTKSVTDEPAQPAISADAPEAGSATQKPRSTTADKPNPTEPGTSETTAGDAVTHEQTRQP